MEKELTLDEIINGEELSLEEILIKSDYSLKEAMCEYKNNEIFIKYIEKHLR